MGTVPTVYRWDDADAPLYPTGNTDYVATDFIGRILKACLVDGYGIKSAAGWTLHDATWPSSGSPGRLILEPASGTGVAEVWLHNSDSTVTVSQVAAGWDGGALVGAVPRVYTLSGSAYETISDPRTDRWCVVANENAMVLLTWRDPAALSGESLSAYNGVVMIMGEMVAVSPHIAAGASPNFAAYTHAYRRGSGTIADGAVFGADDTVGQLQNGVFSLVKADGGLYSGSGSVDFSAWVPGVTGISHIVFWPASPFIPVVPAFLRETLSGQPSVVSRWPGLWLTPSTPSIEQLLHDRDTAGRWTGDLVSLDGTDVVYIASQKSFGYVSLAAGDWP